MNFVVIVSTEAQDNILRNALWWADHHSPTQAELWMDTVYQQIAQLDTMPEQDDWFR